METYTGRKTVDVVYILNQNISRFHIQTRVQIQMTWLSRSNSNHAIQIIFLTTFHSTHQK
jgi:hypothetical protein